MATTDPIGSEQSSIVKDLQWHEPPAYRRAIYYENERADPLNSLKFAGFAFLMLVGIRLLAGFGTDSHPPPWPQTIAVALAVALFLAYGLPALMSLLPGSIVILSDKGINNNVMAGRGWSIRFWPWDEIEYCSIAMDNAGGKSYKVLSLHAADDYTLATLALQDRSSHRDIEEFLNAHGRRLDSTALLTDTSK